MTGDYQWPYAGNGARSRRPTVTREGWRAAWLDITGGVSALLRRDVQTNLERHLVTLDGVATQVEYSPARAMITAVFDTGKQFNPQRFRRARARDRKERDA